MDPSGSQAANPMMPMPFEFELMNIDEVKKIPDIVELLKKDESEKLKWIKQDVKNEKILIEGRKIRTPEWPDMVFARYILGIRFKTKTQGNVNFFANCVNIII